MVTRMLAVLASAVALALLPTAARAQDGSGATPPPARPRLLHAPLSVIDAHEPILIEADFVDAQLLKRAFVLYRSEALRGELAVELLRSPGNPTYVAEIPSKHALVPGFAYTIEIECTDGTRISAFATRSSMHRVAVRENYLDLRERALAERLFGRRSVVSAEAEYVSFGSSDGFLYLPNAGFESMTVKDHYYRVEGSFTYRPLRFVTEFSSRVGVLRGESPVPWATADSGFDVGLDYIAQSVRFRITDAFHADVEGLTGLTEEAFRLGALSRLLIGDPYGSKLVLGVQGVQGFGLRFWSRVDIAASDRLLVSPVVEATNWPHAEAFGVRLLTEVAFDVGAGVGVVAGGGYQARQSTSGGPSGALSVRYSF